MEGSLLSLLAVLLIAWTAGLLAVRIGFPSILGELAAGIVFGPAVLGSMGLGFSGPVPGLEMLAQVGIFALMLFIGMEVNYRDLVRNGKAGALAAVGGFVVPFIAGWAIARWMGYSNEAGSFLGMAMAVTSLATKSRILVDLNLFGTRIANVLLSGALLADVGALLVFALVLGVSGSEAGAGKGGGLLLLGAKCALFFVLAAVCGLKLLPALASLLQRTKLAQRTGTFTFVLLIGLVYAEGAHLLGLHPIIGAFLAGTFLGHGVLKQRLSLEIAHAVKDMAVGFLAPIFFFTAGFHVTLSVVAERPFAVVLVLVAATLTKIVGTAVFYAFSGNGWREGLVIGAGMNGRGAVEIIIAEIALGVGLIDKPLFSMLVLMAFFTTLTVPVSLKFGVRWLEKHDQLVRADADRRGVIVVGATALGRLIARAVAESSGEPVCLVDSNPQRCLRARKDKLPVIRGNAMRDEVLILAGARDASSLIALTPNVSINQLVCQTARELFGVPHVATGWPEHAEERTAESPEGIPSLWSLDSSEVEQKIWEHRAERHAGETEWHEPVESVAGAQATRDMIATGARLPLFLLRERRVLLPASAKWRAGDRVFCLRRPPGRSELADRFSAAIRDASVLDIDGSKSWADFLKLATTAIAESAGEEPQVLYNLLHEREREFSSVLVPGLAIPHASLPGDRPFVMLVARAKDGIVFPGHEEAVRTIFLLLGGETDRDIHLHALSTIARSVSRVGFDEAWHEAADDAALRACLLPGEVADTYEEELRG